MNFGFGGVGFTQYATTEYTDDILDNNVYYDVDYINDKYNGAANPGTDNKVKATLEVVKDIATSLATANANAGLSGWYLSMYLHKEAWGRLCW